ncbi:geranylgeranyl pyrophosphate synthase [Candidatus Nitrosopelagicus brevis]|uniref:Geranylgeranyl pyrophosphate synthase n=1 Tax=Candidatus Nitrosopelagicus brevis TaxID=1410606 RepID=A0A0A7UZU9_9ARCH|nr:polyprenyl synthetase family protein [Candidatus Nitrosopelagicus brevis]MCH2618254.1 polyprenyl synthetase family protein [Candidatus Nitrosopelagicus sp.]MED5275260.1 polyprenyl synthetase family protein [Thermoproteota archaeon]AJA92317.1 polyprenyl synthetase [Candidatus Nitrosopelagicus brevis]MED5542794.1 polyprenyl synthetase family protein [Thermoproteota archaeon]PTL88351.1 geranylgeranyl pyrophosphate synthase [Candidatus Nitrosopelagicus brevis]
MDRKNIEINPLLEVYSKYIEKIDSALDKELELYSESEFCEPLKYALEGGKRIRPIITLLAAESVGQIDENVYAGACAIELLHTESVIHDDIIDNETQRRHKDPFHIKYGYNTSVLTGDFVLGLILNISSRLDKARVTKDLATAAMLMSEGEVLEGKLEESEDVTFEDYIKVMDYKTATAFEMAAKLGAVIGGGSEEEISGLAEYGKNIGIAYQIKDDLMDWKNEDKLFNLLVKKSSDPRVVFNKMEELLKSYAEKASESLRKIRDSDSKHNLEELVSFTDFKA